MGKLEPERLIPGTAGMGSDAIDANEAQLIQNMKQRRNGVWVPRPGLTALGAAYAAAITHVSSHPNGTHVMVIANGKLYYVTAAGAPTEIDTGWPASPNRVKAAHGIDVSGAGR